ncbi:MAG: DUF3341 domain-containing protein [Thermodesulfobacteriota bacterium]
MKRDRQGVLAVFSYLEDVLRALRELQGRGIPVDTVYSPARSDGIADALKMKPSLVRVFTLAGGMLGVATGFGLSIYTAVQWHFVVSGKPTVPFIPYVIEGFEFGILLGVFLNLAGILLLSGMPRFGLPDHYDPRFSEDRYGVFVICAEHTEGELTKMLQDAGAEEIRHVRA